MINELLYGPWLKGLDNFTCSYYVKVRASKKMGKVPVETDKQEWGWNSMLIQRTNMKIKWKLYRSVNDKI